MVLSPYIYPTLASVKSVVPIRATVVGQKVATPKVTKEEQLACLTLSAGATSVTFNKKTGLIDYLDVDGHAMFEEGYSLRPDFWRAPTDNDYGASIQKVLQAWRNPQLNLTSFTEKEQGINRQVVATYDMPEVKAKLTLTYTLNVRGQLVVEQQLTVNKGAKAKPVLPRFGMTMVMPQDYQTIHYYGRGPIENYVDRHTSTFLGEYTQSVAEQFSPYIRPQETGNKTDIRWWSISNAASDGLTFTAPEPLEMTALNYLTSDLDGGPVKEEHQRHAGDLTPRPFTVLHIAQRQMGLGCIDSWGAWPLQKYQIPYADHSFSFVITPVAR